MTAATLRCKTVDRAAVRVALTAALEAQTFDGQPLRVNAWLGDVWAPPCALVGTFTMQYDDPAANGLTTATVSVRLVVLAQAQRPAQLDLDAILSCYELAITGDRTLGGTVADARPVRAAPTQTVRGTQELPSYDAETLIVF